MRAPAARCSALSGVCLRDEDMATPGQNKKGEAPSRSFARLSFYLRDCGARNGRRCPFGGPPVSAGTALQSGAAVRSVLLPERFAGIAPSAAPVDWDRCAL